MTIDLAPLLDTDCSRCAALCCVLLSFDRGEAFAFDKVWGTACRHLASSMRCEIHEELTAEGMAGCVAFECQGAGPRTLRAVFGSQGAPPDWYRDEGRAVLVTDVFGVLRKIHALLELLGAALALELDEHQRKTCEDGIDQLVARSSGDAESLRRLDAEKLHREVHAFLRSLAAAVAGQAPPRRLPVLTADSAPSAPSAPSAHAGPDDGE